MPARSTQGFSLVEVIVAVAIVAVMTAATSLLLQRILMNGREVRDQDLALKIVRNEIESLRAIGYDALPVSGSFADTLLSSLASSSASVQISATNAKTKRAAVSVSWRGTDLANRSVTLTTLITQNSTLP